MTIITNLRIPWSSSLPQDNNFEVSRNQLEDPLNQIEAVDSSGANADPDFGGINFVNVGLINGIDITTLLSDITNEQLGDLQDVDATVSSAPVNGDILFYDGTTWNRIPRGTDGQFLKSTTTSIAWGTGSLPPSIFSDADFQIFDDGDATKIIQFQADQITSGNTRTLTVQDSDGTLAYLTDIPTSLSSFDDSVFNVFDNADNTKILMFQIAGISTSTTRTATWPDKDGTVAFLDDIVVPGNEFFDDVFRIVDNVDNTKKIAFEVASLTTATTRLWTFPDDDDTFVGLATSQTLLNKTIDGDDNTFLDIPVSALADDVDGSLISWDSSGAPTTIPPGTAGFALVSNGPGAEPTYQAQAGAQLLSFVVPSSDETTDLTTGDAKVTFRMPYAFTLTKVKASVTNAPTGSGITVNIRENGVDILSTPITIDATDLTSESAGTPPVISDSSLADDAEMKIDLDAIGSTSPGTGLKVTLIGNPT